MAYSRQNNDYRNVSPHKATSLTKASTGNIVRFKDSSGKVVEGVALYFKSDHLLVGVQSKTKPYVWGVVKRIKTANGGSRKVEGWLPNNSVWAVPFASVTETLSSEYKSDEQG